MIFQSGKEWNGKKMFKRKKMILVQESKAKNSAKIPSTLAVLQTISFLQITGPAFTGTEHSTHKKVTSIGTRLLEWWGERGNLRVQVHNF